jgi:molybdopterin molybdotransferase
MRSELLTVAQAREQILAAIDPLPAECVAIEEALDRVLAQDLPAAGDVPPFASAAMDGYAVRAGPAGRTLQVIGESSAGVPSKLAIGADQAIRTSTGAAVPVGADAVIRQELVDTDGDRVTLRAEVAVADDVRRRGEDFAAGVTAVAHGTALGPAELAAAVAAGVSEVWCGRRPRVEILCTGTELRAPGEPLGPGEIHNANAVTLGALATRCGALATPAKRLADDRPAIEAALAAALERADVVVVSGGVSIGPHDHVKEALAALGVNESFWGVAIQPGKPTWFGTFPAPEAPGGPQDVGRQAGCSPPGELGASLPLWARSAPNSQGRRSLPVFGLPGNPVAAFVAFTLFVRPALLALQGQTADRRAVEFAELGEPVRRNPGRTQAIRVRVERRDGRTIAIPNGPQGSNLISSLLGADALVMIPPGEGDLERGSRLALIAIRH